MQNAHDSPQNAQIKNKRVLVRIIVHLCFVSRAFDASLARKKEVADEKKIRRHTSLFVSVAEKFLHREEEEEESKKIARKIKKRYDVLGPWWP